MDVALLESINNAPDEIWLLARIVLIATLTWITLRLTRRVMHQLIDRKLLTGRGEIAFRGISRVIVLLIAGLFMLEQLGVSTGTVWAAVSAVLVMIAVGFVAVWSVLSNALCSMLLLIYAPFRVGDEVELVDPANGFKLAGRVIDLMDRLGVPFNRTQEGFIDRRRFGGTLYKRTAFAGATTGQQLLYALDE